MIINEEICREIDKAFWDLVEREVERENEAKLDALKELTAPKPVDEVK